MNKYDINWLVQVIKDERETLRQRFESGKGTPNETTFNEGRDWALRHVQGMIHNTDNLELLSQEWIDENKVARINNLKKMTASDVVTVEKLQNLLVPKQELPVIPKYVAEYLDWFKYDLEHIFENDVDLIVSLVQVSHEFLGREEVKDWLNGSGNAQKLIDACRRGHEVEKTPLCHALVKGHELLNREYAFKFWSYDTFDDVVFTSELPFQKGRYITEMSKEAWDNLGINESNADFVKVTEVNINEKKK